MSSVLQQPLVSMIILLTCGLTFLLILPVKFENDRCELPKYIALLVSLATLLVGLLGCLAFDKSTVGFQFLYRYDLLPTYNLSFALGADGLSMTFIMLTLFIFPISILSA